MVKKAAKAKPAAKKNEEKPIKTANPHGGFFGHMYRRYKGNMKKAHTAYTAVAHSVREVTKTKGKDYMVRDYLDSQYGRKLGKKHKDPGHVTLDFKRFAQKYNPQTFKQIEEEAQMEWLTPQILEEAYLEEGKYSHLPHDQKPFHTPWTALKKAAKETFTVGRRKDNAHVPALAAGAVGGLVGGPAVGGAMAASVYGLAMRDNYKQYRKMRQEDADAAEEFIQALIDAGATEAEIALITEDYEPNMELHAAFLDAILNEKPLNATELFEELIAEKLANTVEAYKELVAESLFLDGSEEDEEDGEETDEESEDEELTEEELDELANLDLDELTDEELEELASLFDNIEEVDEEEELEDEETVEEGRAFNEFRAKGAKTDSPPEAAKLAGKALVKGAKNMAKKVLKK